MELSQKTVPPAIMHLPPTTTGKGEKAHQGLLSRGRLEIKLQPIPCVSEHLGSHPSAQGLINNPQPNDGDEYGSRSRGAAWRSEAEGESDLLALLQV